MPTKATLAALEKVWAAEIENRLPYRSRAMIYLRLEQEGLVQEMTRTFPGRFAVTVNGWQLTHVGRIMYCSSCDEPLEDD